MLIRTIILLFGATIINLIQGLIMIVPFVSKFNKLKWIQYVGGLNWRALYSTIENIPIVFSGDPIPTDQQNTILMSNHHVFLDFLANMTVISRMNFLGGNLMVMMKKTIQYYPWIGWTTYFQGGLFMSREWEKDRESLTRKFKQLNNSEEFPQPYVVAMHPEGTRITLQKLYESQAFARSRNLPILNHLLLPRTKGFVHCLKHLRQSCKYLIDLTIKYEPVPLNLTDLFFSKTFQTKRIHIHVNVFDVCLLPDDPKQLEQWLYRLYQSKDHLLEFWKEHGSFPGKNTIIPLDSKYWKYPLFAFYFLFGLGLFMCFFKINHLING